MTMSARTTCRVLVTGGTGYLGTRLIARLVGRGHDVRALVRAGSVGRVPAGCTTIVGDVLKTGDVAAALNTGDTLVHLVGTPHPSPAKAPLFRSVDLASALASIAAAATQHAAHVIYVSVAHPAPVMHAYIDARLEAEAALRASGVDGTIVRPWYVLGPGHQWPHLLRPLYALAEQVPSLRAGARRLGLVTVQEMVGVLAWSVENRPTLADTDNATVPATPTAAPSRLRVFDVPAIRRIGRLG